MTPKPKPEPGSEPEPESKGKDKGKLRLGPELKLKFLADMGISPLTVAWLRERGYDARHLHEEGLDRLPDEAVLEKARKEGRVLLTHDLDFPRLLALAHAEGPSVVLCRLSDMRPESVARHLAQVLDRVGEALAQGALVSVREGQLRLHPLPLSPGPGPQPEPERQEDDEPDGENEDAGGQRR